MGDTKVGAEVSPVTFPVGGSPRNSLEVLTPEVPGERDRGNCITSLQLHPKGWATLLRCSSNTDDQEVKWGLENTLRSISHTAILGVKLMHL